MSASIMKIGALCEQIRGVTYSKDESSRVPRDGYVPVLRANNITENGLCLDDLVYVPESRVSDRQYIRRNDVVIATSSGSVEAVGKAAQAVIDFNGGFGAFCKVLRPNAKVHPGYFSHYFKTIEYRRRVSALAEGASINNLRNEHFDELEIKIPALDEQRRIAAILDNADALRAKRREVIAKIELMLSSAFSDCVGGMTGQPISIGRPKHGDAERYVPLQQVARMATGHTPSRRVPEYWGGNVPWISLSDIRRLDGRIAKETEQSTTHEGIENSSAVILPAMTVCFSRTASVGFSTILGREMATSQDFVNWICGDEIDPFYLMAAFRASRSYLVSNSSGSTHKTIYFPVAERFQVLLPSIERQQRFARIVKSIWNIRDRIETQSAVIEGLFRSIQDRAFQGSL